MSRSRGLETSKVGFSPCTILQLPFLLHLHQAYCIDAAEKKIIEERHLATLQKEKDEVSWLKAELEKVKKDHAAEIQSALSEERDRHALEVEKLRSLLTTSEGELDTLKERAKVWKTAVNQVDDEMNGNFSSFVLLWPPCADMPPYSLPYLGLSTWQTFLQRTSRSPNSQPEKELPEPNNFVVSPAMTGAWRTW